MLKKVGSLLVASVVLTRFTAVGFLFLYLATFSTFFFCAFPFAFPRVFPCTFPVC